MGYERKKGHYMWPFLLWFERNY